MASNGIFPKLENPPKACDCSIVRERKNVVFWLLRTQYEKG